MSEWPGARTVGCRHGFQASKIVHESDWEMRNAAFDIPNRRLAGGYVNKQTDKVGWALWRLDSGEPCIKRK